MEIIKQGDGAVNLVVVRWNAIQWVAGLIHATFFDCGAHAGELFHLWHKYILPFLFLCLFSTHLCKSTLRLLFQPYPWQGCSQGGVIWGSELPK